MPRTSAPITIGVGGFYPWGYVYGGGLGIYDGFYGGYYGAYDPWYGFAPMYAPSSSSFSSSGPDETGAIRLKVKPSEASVYVDGYYVGVVNDFDGAFQRLRLQPGPHRIDIRALNYRPLSVDVMIQEDFTITYLGELKKQ
ncbi:MAG TPA: PEGA domain-containing protein [Vicinamibacterales bacterium]|nr:PEGA domain-containing protein [Vicinamibacterales bacterium]